MRYGVILPNLGLTDNPGMLVDLAVAAEEVGWDGVFVWDAVYSGDWHEHYADEPQHRSTWDPWVALTAIAVRTRRIRLGTMITPIARRRPWKLARETVTLDRLSGGRLILPVGLGAPVDGAFAGVGEQTDRKVRAARLDEGLAVLSGLWSGAPFQYQGEHFQVDEMEFWPPPAQKPRIPVWVVAAWPKQKSMARAAAWDGVIPRRMDSRMGVSDITEMADWLADRVSEPYDIVLQGRTMPGSPTDVARVNDFAAAGVTWWLEDVFPLLENKPEGQALVRERVLAGPCRSVRRRTLGRVVDWTP